MKPLSCQKEMFASAYAECRLAKFKFEMHKPNIGNTEAVKNAGRQAAEGTVQSAAQRVKAAQEAQKKLQSSVPTGSSGAAQNKDIWEKAANNPEAASMFDELGKQIQGARGAAKPQGPEKSDKKVTVEVRANDIRTVGDNKAYVWPKDIYSGSGAQPNYEALHGVRKPMGEKNGKYTGPDIVTKSGVSVKHDKTNNRVITEKGGNAAAWFTANLTPDQFAQLHQAVFSDAPTGQAGNNRIATPGNRVDANGKPIEGQNGSPEKQNDQVKKVLDLLVKLLESLIGKVNGKQDGKVDQKPDQKPDGKPEKKNEKLTEKEGELAKLEKADGDYAKEQKTLEDTLESTKDDKGDTAGIQRAATKEKLAAVKKARKEIVDAKKKLEKDIGELAKKEGGTSKEKEIKKNADDLNKEGKKTGDKVEVVKNKNGKTVIKIVVSGEALKDYKKGQELTEKDVSQVKITIKNNEKKAS